MADQLVRLAGGDARRVLTYLEAAALGLPAGGVIDIDGLERAVDRAMVRYDRAGDQHYDVISAFIKSIRGSDADAALHYLARMIEAGEDPRFIGRRLIVHASEDIGLADPTALQAAVAAAQAVEFVGLPEARLNLAQAVIHLSLAPKSNAVIRAISGRLGRRAGRAGWPGAPAPARCQLRGRGTAGARARLRLPARLRPKASSASSTRPTRSPAAGTTSRQRTAWRPGTPSGRRESARSSAGTRPSSRRARARPAAGPRPAAAGRRPAGARTAALRRPRS